MTPEFLPRPGHDPSQLDTCPMTATDADALAAAHAIMPEPEPMKEELPNSEAYCANAVP